MALKDSAAQSALSLGGQDPTLTNPAPSNGGILTLEGSTLDRDNGATPPKYLDNPPT